MLAFAARLSFRAAHRGRNLSLDGTLRCGKIVQNQRAH
jgi:hypothetical protein